MCGVAGFVDKNDELSPAGKVRIIDSMLACMEHRGRDGVGSYIKDKVVFGHVRLSIIDVSQAASQPFLVEDLALSYNGEIYNYQELDQSLRKKYSYRTKCDTETLIHAYQEWGMEMLKKLKGMFAFSIHDVKGQKIILAVDYFSIKPLYYVETESFFAWASEAKALLELPNFQPVVNIAGLPEYLIYRQFGGEKTPWGEIKRLLPAHALIYDLSNDTAEIVEYWTESEETAPDPVSKEDILESAGRAVQRHLVSDVDVGLQLSGGVDSSFVAALASNIHPLRKFHTFSIGLKDEGWNEFEYSRIVAQKIGSTHHELVFSEEDFCRVLPMVIYHHDEPLHHPHTVPIYLLSLEARKYVKVLLSGEGADELFGGYRRYLKLADGQISLEVQLALSAFNDRKDIQQVFPGLPVPDLEYRKSLLDENHNSNQVEKVLALDRKTYLQSLLIRQDKMGMAANLENRVPFLDQEMVRLALNLSEESKVTTNNTKVMFKDAARLVLPDDIVDRKKCGFGLPIKDWLKHPAGLGRYLSLLREEDSFVRSLSDSHILDSLVNSHIEGSGDYTEILWVAVNLELWHRIFMKGERSLLSQKYE